MQSEFLKSLAWNNLPSPFFSGAINPFILQVFESEFSVVQNILTISGSIGHDWVNCYPAILVVCGIIYHEGPGHLLFNISPLFVLKPNRCLLVYSMSF